MTDSHDNAAFGALVSAIEALQERIHRDGDTIGSNEIRTRTALVDPLLTALGWDTTDPAMVIPEYAAGGGVADYALLKVTQDGNTPVIAFIEAKRLHEPLESHRAQMLTYANMAGVKYAGLTNGDRWELYEVFKEAPLHERRILEVSIRRERAFDCAVQLLPLQWPSMETGEAFSREEAQSLLRQALKASAKPSVISLLLDRGRGIEGKDAEGLPPLHYAIQEKSELVVIEFLLERGARITAQDTRGWTPLHFAALRGDTGLVKVLLEHGADRDGITYSQETPLHVAADSNSDPDTAALLLNWGANIEATTYNDWTPLHFASVSFSRLSTFPVSTDNQKIVSLLLERGANATARTNLGMTPLHLGFLLSKSMGHIHALLEHGADVNALDHEGKTPLHEAVIEWAGGTEWNTGDEEGIPKREEPVRLLICAGADIQRKDTEGRTCLHFAVTEVLKKLVETRGSYYYYSRIELYPIIYYLIDCGADINERNNGGDSAADLLGRTISAVLATVDEDDNRPEIEDELTASLNLLQHGLLFSQRFWFSNPSVEQVRAEVNKGIAITSTDNHDMTPLHYAVQQYHNYKPIEYLLDSGADIMARDSEGYTPLHSVMYPFHRLFVPDYTPKPDYWHWKVGTVDTLLAYGADVTATDNNGDTPLHHAVACGSGKIGRVFMSLLWPQERLVKHPNKGYIFPQSQGADIEAQNSRGETPLHIAVQRDLGNTFLEMLINSFVVNMADASGETPLHWAARWATADNIRFLLDRGADVAATDNDGRTPYQLAEEQGVSEEILRLLRT